MTGFSTYLPTELGKILAELKLQGRTISKIESPSIVFSSIKKGKLDEETKTYKTFYKDAEIDLITLLTLDDGRRIGFDFGSVSHVGVFVDPDIDVTEEADYSEGDTTVTDLFKNIIGKKIKDFHIHTTNDINELRKNFGYEDGGFDENQESFITQVDIVFEKNDRICFENDIDFTLVHYDKLI